MATGAARHRRASGVVTGATPTQIQGARDWDDSHVLTGADADRQVVLAQAALPDRWNWDWLLPGDSFERFANGTGFTLALGDVVAVSTGQATLDDSAASLNLFAVCAEATLAVGATGRFSGAGIVPAVSTAGAVTAGHYVVKAATTRTVQDSGVIAGPGVTPPLGALGVAMATTGGAGLARLLWWRQPSTAQISIAIPPGVYYPFAGAALPIGHLWCDGAAYSRTGFSNLFSAIGILHGIGDGSTTFNVPNLKGRGVMGYDVTQTEFNTIGKVGGEKAHLLTTTEMPSHTHLSPDGFNFLTAANGPLQSLGAGAVLNNGGNAVQATGGSVAHNVLDPYVTTPWIIKF